MWAIQSILLNKNHFKSRTRASIWIRKHDFLVSINPNPNKSDNANYRYRQRQPSIFKEGSFRNNKMNSYLTIVYGEIK